MAIGVQPGFGSGAGAAQVANASDPLASDPSLTPIVQVGTTLVRQLTSVPIPPGGSAQICGERPDRIALIVDCLEGIDFYLSLSPLSSPPLLLLQGSPRSPVVIHSAFYGVTTGLKWYAYGDVGRTIRVWEITDNRG